MGIQPNIPARQAWKFWQDKWITSDDLSNFLTHLMTVQDLMMNPLSLGDDILMTLMILGEDILMTITTLVNVL